MIFKIQKNDVQAGSVDIHVTFDNLLLLEKSLMQIVRQIKNRRFYDRFQRKGSIVEYKFNHYWNEQKMRFETINGKECLIIKSKI